MSEDDRRKWDDRYRAGSYAQRLHPCAYLETWADELPGGRVLDVACGAGRNSLYLAASGYGVDAVDISSEGLAMGRARAEGRDFDIRWIEADLETDAEVVLPNTEYGTIVLVRYVNADLFVPLLNRLAPGGVLLCEQHLDSADDVVGPSNPGFRVRPGELLRQVLQVCGPQDVVRDYQEGIVTDPDGRRAALARLLLKRSATPD